MRGVLDEYLPPEAREQRTGHVPVLTSDQIAGVRMRALMARSLPRSLRGDVLNRIAREYAISRRTVYRYANSRTFEVVVDGWRAHFTTSPDGAPRQSSPWVKS